MKWTAAGWRTRSGACPSACRRRSGVPDQGRPATDNRAGDASAFRRKPRRVEEVQEKHDGAHPRPPSAEAPIALRAQRVVRAARDDERQLDEPPADGQRAPQAQPDVRCRARPESEVAGMHRPIEQEMREHGDAQHVRDCRAKPREAERVEERPEHRCCQRVRPVDEVEAEAGRDAGGGSDALEPQQHEHSKQQVEQRHADEQRPGRRAWLPRLERERGGEVAGVHQRSLRGRSSHASNGIGSAKAKKTNSAIPVELMGPLMSEVDPCAIGANPPARASTPWRRRPATIPPGAAPRERPRLPSLWRPAGRDGRLVEERDEPEGGTTMKPVCVVAGVGPGNGAAFARRFASGGYAVALLARTTELTGKLASSLPDACAYPCDVTDAGSIARAFDATRRDLGDVDVLVYNASKSTAVASSMLPQTPEPRVMRRGAS